MMSDMLLPQYLLFDICRWLLIYCFAVGAVAKTMAFREFCQSLTDGFKVPFSLHHIVAIAVITTELLIAANLALLPFEIAIIFSLSLLLLAIFTVVLLWALRQEQQVSCHCFGQSESTISGLDIWRNGLLMAACLPGIFLPDIASATADLETALLPQFLTALLALPVFVMIVHFKQTLNLVAFEGAY